MQKPILVTVVPFGWRVWRLVFIALAIVCGVPIGMTIALLLLNGLGILR